MKLPRFGKAYGRNQNLTTKTPCGSRQWSKNTAEMQFAIEYYSLQKRHKSTIIVTTTTIVTYATYLPIFTALYKAEVCAQVAKGH